MNFFSKQAFSLLIAATSFSYFSSAQEFVSQSVGYSKFGVNAEADRRMGIPFERPKSCSGTVETVVANTLSTTATVPDVTTDAHYILFTSGVLLGKWYQVISYSSSSLTVNENLQAAGLVIGDNFKVVPFWTLDTLFPGGGSIPPSSDAFDPAAFVLLNDPTGIGTNLAANKVFFYYNGSPESEGWYDNDNLGGGLAGSTPLEPGAYLTIRNGTSSLVSVAGYGDVPDNTVSNEILSRSAGAQDNQIANPYPTAVTLRASRLFEDGVVRGSSDVFDPVDYLLVYEGIPSGFNPAASRVLFYYDGSQVPEGWYDNDNLGDGPIDDYEIDPGAALVVRRSSGTDELISWSPPLPTKLQ